MRLSTLALSFTLVVSAVAQDSRVAWKPATDTYSMWLRSDLTTNSGVTSTGPQDRFRSVWRINGEYRRVVFGYVYGELDDRSRGSIESLTTAVKSGFKPDQISHWMSQDFDFKNFVSGTENGWHGFRARRVSFESTVDNIARQNEALMMIDGRSRVWTFVVGYPVGYNGGAEAADRLLSSIQIMNKIDVGDDKDHYRAKASTNGRIWRDITGRYVDLPRLEASAFGG